MGTVTNLAEYRKKKEEASPGGLYIANQEEYAYYSSELRQFRAALKELEDKYPAPKDPNDPKRIMFIDITRRHYADSIEVIDKALDDYAGRNFKPALIKAVEDGDLLTALPESLPESLILRTRVTLMDEYHRVGYLVDALKNEINNAVPFRDGLIALHDKQLALQLKIKRVMIINGWWEEDKA